MLFESQASVLVASVDSFNGVDVGSDSEIDVALSRGVDGLVQCDSQDAFEPSVDQLEVRSAASDFLVEFGKVDVDSV